MISAINYSAFCNQTDDPIRNFFLLTNDEIFYVLDYSATLAMWGKLQNFYSTFIWNYMDIFVMIISIGLASKFRQLNDNLLTFKGMVSTCGYLPHMVSYISYPLFSTCLHLSGQRGAFNIVIFAHCAVKWITQFRLLRWSPSRTTYTLYACSCCVV